MKVPLLAVAAALFAVLQLGPFVLGPLVSWAFATHSYSALTFWGWSWTLLVSVGAAYLISRSYRLAGPRLVLALVVGTAATLGIFAGYTAWLLLIDHSRPLLVFISSNLGVVLLNALQALAATAAAWLCICAVARPARERT